MMKIEKADKSSFAGTEAEQSTSADNEHVSQPIAKPNVSSGLSEKDKAWSQGFAAACAITLSNHGCDTIVEDTFRCNFMDEPTMRRRGVDEYDIEILKPIIKEIKRKRSVNGC